VTELRLGEILVESGVLTQGQAQRVLAEQRQTGQPFGVIAERMFNVAPGTVEEAWAVQYARLTRTIDPQEQVFEPRATELITRRQAWQFRVLPVRWDGQELMIATTPNHLRRALRFATNVLAVPSYLVMAEARKLGDALCRHYPLPGMTPQSVDDDGMDRLLAAGGVSRS
jgi:hypothetical protein